MPLYQTPIVPPIETSVEIGEESVVRLMDKILHDLKDPKVWELRYIPYYG